MMAKNILITGTNRGIGFEMVKQFAKSSPSPKNIFACCRNPDDAKDLQSLASEHPAVKILKLDVCDESSYDNFEENVRKVVGDDGLNLLINNAGAMPKSAILNQVTSEQLNGAFRINTIAPFMLTQKLLPLLKDAANRSKLQGLSIEKAAVVNTSSLLASIGDNGGGKFYAYRASKTALNAITKSLSIDLKDDQILVICLDPGWVKTDMGGPNGTLTTEESVSHIIKTLGQLTSEDSGKFVKYNGLIAQW